MMLKIKFIQEIYIEEINLNELSHIKEKYDLTSLHIDKRTNINPYLIFEIINNAEHSNSPDIISKISDTIYGIEHFEYDCYRKKAFIFSYHITYFNQLLHMLLTHRLISYLDNSLVKFCNIAS